MLRAMLRDLRAHLGRVAMTLVAIVLGVGFLVATWVVSDSAAATATNGSNRPDIAVQVMSHGDGLTEAQRQRLAEQPGVTGAAGVIAGYAALVKSDGKIGDSYYPEAGGTNWDSSQRFALVSGRGPAGSGEVALEEETAAQAGVGVGSSARVLLADGKSDTAKVVGVFTYRKSGFEETPALAYEEKTARTLLGATYARIELFGADQQKIAAASAATLGSGYEVTTGTELAKQRERDAGELAAAIRNFLLAFAGVALVVGMFVIANTFTMLVAQRTRHFALLRAVGASRGQVRRALLAEAAVLGLVGATIGIAVGAGLGVLALTLLRNAGETMVYVVSPVAIGLGYAVGVLVTVVAAYGSARRGAAVAPMAALRTDAALPRRSLVIRTVAGALALVGGVATVLATAHTELTDPERAVGMAGAMVAWLGVLLLAPLLVTSILGPVTRLFGSTNRVIPRVALRNAIRDPRRTAATASALMIGLALVCSFATVGETFTSAFTSAIKNTVPAETLVVQSASTGALLDNGALDRIKAVSAVDGVLAPRHAYGEVTRQSQLTHVTVSAVTPKELGTVLTPKIMSGRADLAAGVLLSETLADNLKASVGETMTVDFGEGKSLSAKVTGIYEQGRVLGGVLVDQARLPQGVPTMLDAIYARGPNPAAARAGLDAAFADRPDVVVLDREALIEQSISPLKLALNIIYGLLGAAVVIAIFGVVNTLALSVLERTREIGVFRAVGATRRLVRRSVRLESVVIAAYGGLLGVGVGLLLGGVMQHVILSRPILSIATPWSAVGVALIGMVVVGVLAALWPARRAARTDVLAAISVE